MTVKDGLRGKSRSTHVRSGIDTEAREARRRIEGREQACPEVVGAREEDRLPRQCICREKPAEVADDGLEERRVEALQY